MKIYTQRERENGKGNVREIGKKRQNCESKRDSQTKREKAYIMKAYGGKFV